MSRGPRLPGSCDATFPVERTTHPTKSSRLLTLAIFPVTTFPFLAGGAAVVAPLPANGGALCRSCLSWSDRHP